MKPVSLRTLPWPAVTVLILGVVYYAAMSFIFPLHEGRDEGTYFLYFRDILRAHPEYPLLMLFRTPLTPLFYGLCFHFLGLAGTKIVLSLGYGAIVTCIYCVLASYRKWVGVMGVALLLAHFRLFEWYNAVGSETMQTLLLTVWATGAFFAMGRAGLRIWIVLALVTFLLILNRPGNQVLLAGFVLPFFNGGIAWRRRFVRAAAYLGTGAALVLGYCTYNFVRYDAFRIALLGGAHIPFYRMYMQDRLVSPGNGPRSAELAELVRTRILTDATFQRYGIDEKTFFTCGTSRMFDAMIRASVETRGWDGDFRLFHDTGWEAVKAHPAESFLSYADGVAEFFHYRENKRPLRLSDQRGRYRIFKTERDRRYAEYAAKGLAVPGEGDLLTATGWWLKARPEGYVVDDTKILNVSFNPQRWTYETVPPQSDFLKSIIVWSVLVSPSWIYLLVGFAGTLIGVACGSRDIRLFLVTGIPLGAVLLTFFGVLIREFRYPFDPIFTAFFCYGIYACVLGVARMIQFWKNRQRGSSTQNA